MAMVTLMVFTPAQAAAAVTKSAGTTFKVLPREIDNPLAGNLGDPVVAVGNFVANGLLLNNPEYAEVWQESLGGLPIRILDTDVIYLPPIV